jgi:pilus assembly protein Flp/PilA
LRTPLLLCSIPLAPDPENVSLLRQLARHALNFLHNEDGPTAVEYAVMLALIIVVCITAITTLGSNANNTFSYVGSQISGAGS